jgi:hypothetical protein
LGLHLGKPEERHALYWRDGKPSCPNDAAPGKAGIEITAKYSVARLVHVEHFERIDEAIAREKAIKKWRRAWKVALIEKGNPEWGDLFEHILDA